METKRKSSGRKYKKRSPIYYTGSMKRLSKQLETASSDLIRIASVIEVNSTLTGSSSLGEELVRTQRTERECETTLVHLMMLKKSLTSMIVGLRIINSYLLMQRAKLMLMDECDVSGDKQERKQPQAD